MRGGGNDMGEWEKMLNGEVYNDFDDDLFKRRVEAKKLFKAYNATSDEETSLRQELLAKLFKRVGKNVWIEPDFHCEFGKNIVIGDNVYINFGCVILDCGNITIGRNTLIGPNCGIYAANHSTHYSERIQGGCYGKPITIGENVWIGGDVKLLQGVKVGDNSIIGAGSVVTKDVPPDVIACGNPCRVLRRISEQDKTGYKPE